MNNGLVRLAVIAITGGVIYTIGHKQGYKEGFEEGRKMGKALYDVAARVHLINAKQVDKLNEKVEEINREQEKIRRFYEDGEEL